MDLTKSQKRELMWLASVAGDGGAIDSWALEERSGSLGEATIDDWGYRYDALEEAGYVDQRIRAWGCPVVRVRLTEEGRERAEQFLKEELDDPLISDDTKRTVKDAVLSQGIAAGFRLLLLGVGFM